ncbi:MULTISPECIES: DUF4339 domain-containing protein [Akkermansia]|uniref:DUF4339 domain-containing protein n=1 Tax=unclassified Akkermansia TaxID=2608915 RepID=UPI000A3E14CF|nr:MULTISPECIES: DUF4339 domain-containing protein [Akkermansia]MBT9563534.1 DUF4339 domain-containing protein [Candidatus Akkermansia timonensis]MBT9602251.1 DUF4339 domain-containing protein [Akkermansia muciniphila]
MIDKDIYLIYLKAMKYFVAKSSDIEGPYSLQELETLRDQFIIDSDTPICAEGTERWFPADDLLFTLELLRENNKVTPLVTNTICSNHCKNHPHSLLKAVLILLCIFSIGGGLFMGVSCIAGGIIDLGFYYIFGGIIASILWYTLYVLLTKK